MKMGCKILAKLSFEKAILLLTCFALMVVVGCRSTGYIKSDTAVWRLRQTANMVNAENVSIETTVNVLSDLVTNASGDLRLQYGRFSQELDKLSALNTRASGSSDALRKRGAEYFEIWTAELLKMNDGQIRQASAARKSEVSGQFGSIVDHCQTGQAGLAPFVDYLKDIRKALSTDLTIAGVQAARLPAESANQRSAKIKKDLVRTASDWNTLGDRMSFLTAQVPTNDSRRDPSMTSR